MQRAVKLQVVIGKDHVVKLPSEFPEGPADVIVMARDRSAALSSNEAATVGEARRAAVGRYNGLGFKLQEDFDAPLPPDIQRYFDGEDDEDSAQ